MKIYKTRKDVPEKYKWNIEQYFNNIEEFKKELDLVQDKIKSIKNYVGCTSDAKKLFEYLENDVDLGTRIMNLEIYAMMLSDQDLSKSEPIELQGSCSELFTKYICENAFFEPELLKLSNEEFNNLIKDKKLSKYIAYLNNSYRFKDHYLNKNEQQIVASLTQTMGNYGNMNSSLNNSNHDYGSVLMKDGSVEQLTTTNYTKIMKQLPREKRKEVYEQFNKVRDQYASINAGFLNGYVKNNNNLALIYKYNSAWDEKLFKDKLNDKVYDALINACIKNNDILCKYDKLKAKVLNLDCINPWDSVLDLYKTNKDYTIEEAQNICLDAIKPLGEDYVNRFRLLINDRAVDYCQYKGKCSGGYNVSSIGKRISNILMSFNNDLDSISTLAHEGGHFTHHTYIYDNNDALYREHSSIICEVASLTNECLLSSYLVNNGSKEEALAGLSNLINVILMNLFSATREGYMEKEFYKYSLEGGTLTKDYLYNLTEKNLKLFYPKKEIISDYQKCGWLGISHYYMNFYLFNYAICISVATNVAKEILAGNKEMLENYKKFLSCGSDIDIIDVFKIINIDLEDGKVYQNAIDYFDDLLDKFDRIYEEVNNGSK